MNAAPIPRIENLTPEELERDFLLPERPVILTRAIETWPARRWTFESLQQTCGEQELRVRGGDRMTWRLLGRVKANHYFDFLAGRTDRLSASSPLRTQAAHNPYAAFNSIRKLEKDVAFERLVLKDYALTAAMMWIGPKGSLTPLHYDASGISLFAQIAGRKRFILYPFEQTPYLYPSDIFDYQSVFSEVNLDQPDLDRHPAFAKAKALEVELEPGEMLFIPNKMWHQVIALDNSISISRRMTKHALFSPETLQWYGKAFLHLLGVYKSERCLCHIDELTPTDLAVYSRAIRLLVKVGGLKAHGRDLPELIGWR